MKQNETQALLDQWFQEYKLSLRRYICKTINCGPDEAEDFLMEVFKRALPSLHARQDEILYPEKWLKKIAKYVCLEEIKKRTRERIQLPRSFLTEEEKENLYEDDIATQPGELLMQQERNDLLYKEISALPKNEEMAIRYHYTKEMSVQETAQKVGRSSSSVYKDIHQGLRTLRIRLTQDN